MWFFNDAFNTFCLQVYDIGHMVKYHSDGERGNPLLPHGLLFPISNKGSLYAPSYRQDSTHYDLCYTSCGVLAGPSNSSMIKYHSDGEGGNPLPPLLTTNLFDYQQEIFYTHHPTTIHTTTFCYTRCGALVGTRNHPNEPMFGCETTTNRHYTR